MDNFLSDERIIVIYEFHTLSPEALNKHLGLKVGMEVQVIFVSDDKVEQHHLIQKDYLA